MKSLSPEFVESRRSRKLSCFAVLSVFVLFLAVFAVPAFAQEATVVGTVTDPSGAAVPNVSITITNNDTGLSRTLVTSAQGDYVVPDLGIGHYTVRAQATGFKAVEQKGLVLAVGDRARVDFKLTLGTATEQVTVEAAAIAVQADSGEVSDVITGQQLSQLSTNGRSMYSLISLTPGASSGQGDFQIPTPVGGDANVSFNGMRESHNLYLLDGSESSDRGGGGGSDVMPSMDAIAEFRTMTSNYSAEYGLSSAATMTAVIKSGSKQYHASGWEFLRNDALDARGWFNPAPHPVAELRFNTYGFNAGGPVDFWKKEHKTFFFYNMEWRSLIQGQTLDQVVPFQSWYGGSFNTNLPADSKGSDGLAILHSGFHTPCASQISSGLAAQLTGAGQTLSTPDASGSCSPNSNEPAALNPAFQPWTQNAIPATLLDPNAQLLLNAGGKYGGIFPAENGTGTSAQHFIGGNNVPTHVREEIIRVDHQFNSKFSIYGHYLAEQIAQNFGTSMWSGDNVPTASNTFGNPSRSAVVHTTYVISPTLLNEVAFNYNGNKIAILPTGTVATPSGYNVSRLFTGPNNDNRIPEIHLGGSTGTDYTTASWPWNNKADDYQIRDDISWTKGAHQIKMGGSWAIYKKVQDLFGNTQGSYQFNNTYTGNDFADYLLGWADTYTELGVQDHGLWNNVSWAAYVQDNWRVNHRLTLNLGLRWDGVPHTYEANNRMGNFYPNLYNQSNVPAFANDGAICGAPSNGVSNVGCAAASPGLSTSPNPILAGYQFYTNGIGIPGTTPGVPKGLVNNHWAAFGPRIGFAYDLTGSGKTILRGGFGTMYERIQGNDMYNAGPNVPFSTNVTINNDLFSSPTTLVSNGSTFDPTAEVTVGSITGLNGIQNKLPVSYQYSFGVQHALSAHTVLTVQYVGNQNRHQNDYRETDLPSQSLLPCFAGTLTSCPNGSSAPVYNQSILYPGFHSIKLSEDVQNSHYNGLQFEVHSQIRRDLTLQAAYTYSKAFDPAASGNGVSDLNNVSNPYSYAYDNGPSGLDRRQIAFVNFVYDIPFLKDSSSRLLRSTVGGWQVSGIVTLGSGEPLNVALAGVSGNVANFLPNSSNRPDASGSVKYLKTKTAGVGQWFDPSSGFATPNAGSFGNVARNSLIGPGRQNWNLSLFKSFLFSESRGSRLEFRAEFFNAFNHTEFNGVNTTFLGGGFGQVNSAHDPREIQLGLKLYF